MKHLSCTNLLPFLCPKQVSMTISPYPLMSNHPFRLLVHYCEQRIDRLSPFPCHEILRDRLNISYRISSDYPALEIRVALCETGLALFKEEHVRGTQRRTRHCGRIYVRGVALDGSRERMDT